MKTKFTLKAAIFFCVLSFMAAIPAVSKPDKTMPEPPSGTKPAESAIPGEKPAEPAVPGDKTDKVKPETDKPDTPKNDKTQDKDIKDNGKQETPDKDKTTKEEVKDDKKPEDKQKTGEDKDSKNEDKKDKSKKGKPKKGSKLSPSVSSPSSSQGAGTGAGGGILGGILGIFGGSGDKKKQDKSSETVSGIKPDEKSTSTIVAPAVSTTTTAVKPAAPALFSEGSGPKIAVFDFEGESGKEFADTLSDALSSKNFKVYNRNILEEKGMSEILVNRATIKKISNEMGCDYLVTGKISRKTEILFIISVFLKNGKNADIKMTDFVKIKEISELKKASEQAAEKIKNSIN